MESAEYKEMQAIILINLALVLIRVKEESAEEAIFYARKGLQLVESLFGNNSFKVNYLSIFLFSLPF